MLEQGKSVRSPAPEEEGTAETCDELTTTPIPHPLHHRRGAKWREGFFNIWFHFLLSYTDLISNKLISPN